MTTTKSPIQVLQRAYDIGREVFRAYSHRCSPKTFTQPQLFACLALKEFLRLDYRGLAAIVGDFRELRSVIGLRKSPHYTTYQKAAKRLLEARRAKRALRATVRRAVASRVLRPTVSLAAMDSTGMESHHVSAYYVRRRAKGGKTEQNTTYCRYPKMGVVCDCKSHFVLALVPGQGPGPDILHFRAALNQASKNARIATLAADAGYDSEATHEYARKQKGVRTLIPATIGRPTKNRLRGYWRRQMKSRLHLTRYGQRWQVETVNSMFKRLLGCELRARSYWSRCREMMLMAITLNIMLLAATEPPVTKCSLQSRS